MGRHKKLPRELIIELLYLELPTYFSLLLHNNIYALHFNTSENNFDIFFRVILPLSRQT